MTDFPLTQEEDIEDVHEDVSIIQHLQAIGSDGKWSIKGMYKGQRTKIFTILLPENLDKLSADVDFIAVESEIWKKVTTKKDKESVNKALAQLVAETAALPQACIIKSFPEVFLFEIPLIS
jgi:hypothetical protein